MDIIRRYRTKEMISTIGFLSVLVEKLLGRGLEPLRYCYQGILSPF